MIGFGVLLLVAAVAAIPARARLARRPPDRTPSRTTTNCCLDRLADLPSRPVPPPSRPRPDRHGNSGSRCDLRTRRCAPARRRARSDRDAGRTPRDISTSSVRQRRRHRTFRQQYVAPDRLVHVLRSATQVEAGELEATEESGSFDRSSSRRRRTRRTPRRRPKILISGRVPTASSPVALGIQRRAGSISRPFAVATAPSRRPPSTCSSTAWIWS